MRSAGSSRKKSGNHGYERSDYYGEGRHFSSGADVEQLIHNTVSMSDICRGEVRSYPSWFWILNRP